MNNNLTNQAESLAIANPGKLAFERDELIFKAVARSNSGIIGPILTVLVTLIIFPVAIYYIYTSFLMGYKINLKTGDFYKTALGNETLLMNLKTDFKYINEVHLKLAGGNVGKMVFIVSKAGKPWHVATFINQQHIDTLNQILNDLAKS